MTVEHPEPDPAFVLRILRLFDRIDARDDLFWRTPATGLPYRFLANCSDLFWWGTADLEEITEENIHLLEQAMEDIIPISRHFTYLAPELFVARLRKQRPQGAWYQQMRKLYASNKGEQDKVEQVLELFDACGPEREPGLGNPHRQHKTES